jgi:hypothetical protein
MWSLDVRNQFARIAIAIAFIPSELQYLTGQLLHALVMGSRGVTIYRSVLLVVLASFAVELAAEGFGLTGSKQVNDRPDASGPPTEVNIGIYLLDIYDIDDVNQAFSVDLLFYVRWHDPRLALPENERAGWNRRIPLEEIWTPRLLVVNDRGLTPQLPLVAEIDDLGNVYARQRAYGKLSANLLFEDFPFDAQHLPIRIVSHGYSPRDLRFSLDDEFRSDLGSFSAEGWSFRILGSRFDAVPMPDSDEGWARLTYSIEAQRNSRYYILTVFLPVSLIVIMSWLVFWLPPDVIPSRVGISTASIFSLIAFILSIRMSLPRVSYVTHADLFLLGCTLIVILALAIVVMGSRWVKSDRLTDALRLNAWARGVYVILYGLIAIIALVI